MISTAKNPNPQNSTAAAAISFTAFISSLISLVKKSASFSIAVLISSDANTPQTVTIYPTNQKVIIEPEQWVAA